MVPFDTPLPIDQALPRLTAALGARTTPPCWWRRRAPGRPRACRWSLLDEPWAKNKKYSCWSRGGWPPARRRADGRDFGREGRRDRRPARALRLGGVEPDAHRGGHRGVFTRLVLEDPLLEGVAAVLFDEFHERSLDADLGLALARDAQQGLREDLRLLVMSATSTAPRRGASWRRAGDREQGRAFPVETRYLGRDPRADRNSGGRGGRRGRCAQIPARLVFLPGAGEIRRTRNAAARADPRSRRRIVRTVRRARRARAGSRHRAGASRPHKIVLATSIAETSLTIEGVRIVVD